MLTSFDFIPTKLTKRTFESTGTLMEKFPSMSAIPPKVVPLTITVAPGIGDPFSSCTVPLSCFFCGCCETSLVETVLVCLGATDSFRSGVMMICLSRISYFTPKFFKIESRTLSTVVLVIFTLTVFFRSIASFLYINTNSLCDSIS